MIITTAKHGRTERDSKNLIAHLTKTENVNITLAEIGNCVAETLREFTLTAAIYRDAVFRADARSASFHHLSINPAHDHPREALLAMVHRARLELDPSGQRPFAIVIHRKPRAEPGGSEEHAHLLIAAADESGKFLDDGWSKVRTERLALELAYDFGEAPIVGRHYKAALRRLVTTRPDVAFWLEGKVGTNPAKPEAAFSPNARARARGQKLNLPKAKAGVHAAWADSSDIETFHRKLAEFGFVLQPGDKTNVWIIKDGKGRLVGSANRLLKLPRGEFNTLMTESRNAAELKRGTPPPRERRFDHVAHTTTDRSRQKSGGAAGLAFHNQRETGQPSGSFHRGARLTQISRQHLLALLKKTFAIQQRYERHSSSDARLPSPDDVYLDLWGIARSTAPPPKLG